MVFSARPEAHRAVNPCAGIPAGIGLVGITGNYFNSIFSLVHICITIHIEIGISVRPESGLLPVDDYFCFAVDSFEFKDIVLCRFLSAERKGLAVKIVSPLKPADI